MGLIGPDLAGVSGLIGLLFQAAIVPVFTRTSDRVKHLNMPQNPSSAAA
jgi:hypothetical protein